MIHLSCAFLQNEPMKKNLPSGNFRPTLAPKLVIPALLTLAVSCAHGALVVLTQVDINLPPSTFQPLAGDLLETSVTSFTGENPNALVRNGAFTGTPVTADAPGGPFPAQVWGQASTIYNFNLTTSPSGYDITLIQAYSAWADRYNQSYQIFYAQVGSPSTFVQLGTNIVATAAGTSSIITRSVDSVPGTSILSNVSSIEFRQFSAGNLNDGTQTVYRELDVVGFASIPEPATSVLGLGAAILLLYRRRS